MPLSAGLVKTAISLIVIVNPIGAIPLFVSLTHGRPEPERRRIAATSALATTVTLFVAMLIGKWLLLFFGISLPSFRVAGGILLILMAVDMVNARPSRSRHTPEEHAEAIERPEIGVIPIAIPQLSGPGAIGSVILYMDTAHRWHDLLPLSASILLIGLLSWAALRLAPSIGRALGRTGINILTRIMGLILTAVGVEFITGGLRVLWGGMLPQ